MAKHSSREEYNAYMRDYMLRRYHKRRALIIERLGGKCAICGATEGLEIDHVDSKGKSFNIARRLSGVAETKLEEELKKCQLLCRVHHGDKSLVDTGKKRAKGSHGTVSTYRYCHCPECRNAHNEYGKMYKRKQRAHLNEGP